VVNPPELPDMSEIKFKLCVTIFNKARSYY
jgi:hypothetical protein